MSTNEPIKPTCMAFSPRGFICTLSLGHDGPHIAHGEYTPVVSAWPSDKQTAAVLDAASSPPSILLLDEKSNTPKPYAAEGGAIS